MSRLFAPFTIPKTLPKVLGRVLKRCFPRELLDEDGEGERALEEGPEDMSSGGYRNLGEGPEDPPQDASKCPSRPGSAEEDPNLKGVVGHGPQEGPQGLLRTLLKTELGRDERWNGRSKRRLKRSGSR